MTPDPCLLVPLTALKVVPQGAPLWWRAHMRRAYYAAPFDADYAAIMYGFAADHTALLVNLALDLSPPDPPGSRVDGLDVALRLLGRQSRGRAEVTLDAIHYFLRIEDPDGTPHLTEVLEPMPPVGLVGDGGSGLLNDTVLRLAVAAVLRAGGAR